MSPLLGSSHDLNPRDIESLLRALSTREGRSSVVSLQDGDAEAALTLMLKELKDLDVSGSQSDPRVRAGLFRIILDLTDTSHRVPACLWLSDIQEGEQMANGAFGVVQKGSWKGKAVALKFPHGAVMDNFKQFMHEVLLWYRLSHKNVLPFLGLYQDGPKKAMVSPWQRRGNVVDFIRKHPEEDRHRLLIQVTDGLSYLHELKPPIVHSDLKPENILISHDKTAVLADFGLSRMQRDYTELMSSDLPGMRGTLPYCAPELLADTPNPCQLSRDIWALGMVIYRVFTGESPYQEHAYPMGIWNAIKGGVRPKARNYVTKKRGFTDEVWDFLENHCWKMNQEERQSARSCKARLKLLTSRWEHEKAAKVASGLEDFVEEIIPVKPAYFHRQDPSRTPYFQCLSEQYGVRIMAYNSTFAKIKIVGDQANVQAAMKDIIRDQDNMTAPSTSASLSVPGRLRGVVLGRGGESIKALEKEFSVTIHISQIIEQGTIKGPPDNVAKAKDRLQSILEYHQLHDDFYVFPVSQKVFNRLQSPRYRPDCSELGLRELRTHGDKDKSITMRGSKIALEKAREYFYRLQEKMDKEITVTLTNDIDQLNRLVTGQDWSDIVLACNGPSDPQLQKDLVTRRQEEKQIILTGERTLIESLKCKLELEVERRRKLVHGMKISHDLHGALLHEPEHDIEGIQKKHRVFICFPGRRPEYNVLPEPENLLDELFEVDTEDIVKIHGNREACTLARQMLNTCVEQERRLRLEVIFGAKYGDEVHCLVDAQLRDMNIRVVSLSRPPGPLSPHITLMPLPQTPSTSWGSSRRFDLEDKEEYILKLRARPEQLDEAKRMLTEAVMKVSAASYTGRLEFSAPLPNFGQLIGTKGDTVRRLEGETDTTIRVDDPRVDITGSKKNVKFARDKILRLLGSSWVTVANVTSE